VAHAILLCAVLKLGESKKNKLMKIQPVDDNPAYKRNQRSASEAQLREGERQSNLSSSKGCA
jgi:hypothetical protein